MQSISISFKFVHACLLLYFYIIYTLFSCFERLFLCFTQFGGDSQCLDFDKFCDTVPLRFDAPHICTIALWWIAIRRYLSYFYRWKATSNTLLVEGIRKKGPLIAGQALAQIKIIGFLLSQYMTDHKLVQLRYYRCSQLID